MPSQSIDVDVEKTLHRTSPEQASAKGSLHKGMSWPTEREVQPSKSHVISFKIAIADMHAEQDPFGSVNVSVKSK